MNDDSPFPGCVQIPADKPSWISLLKRVYEFESTRVAAPGSFRRDIRDVLWTREELQNNLNLEDTEKDDLRSLLDFLFKSRQLMRIPPGDGFAERFVTRVAEIVRVLGHTYEYWHRGRPGVNVVRWLVEEKKVPARTIPAPEFIAKLDSVISEHVGEGDETFNLRKAVEIAVKSVAMFYSEDWQKTRFSPFQLVATEEMLLSQYKDGYTPDAQILTAGVGSGKTIGFSVATLVSAVEAILGGEESRRCHLLVYPRKALARNQFGVLSDYARNLGVRGLRIHFEHASHYLGALKYRSVKEGIRETYGTPGPGPDIIITTFETLKRRLQHPLFARKIARYLCRVVLDEVHLAEGLSGAHIAMLMSRLSALVPGGRVRWTASSATVASPDEHAARLFGIDGRRVRVIAPTESELEVVGLVHHVFLRPSGRISNLGVLVNATSMLVHGRRDDVGLRTKDDRKRPKAIGFADNLDLLGRWNADLRENERTEETEQRRHPTASDFTRWDERQREIPYALRFHKPLQKRIESEGGVPERLEPVLVEHRGRDLCTKCMKGERVSLGKVDASVLRRLSTVVYRNPHGPADKPVKLFHLDNDVFREQEAEVGTLDLCPYLRAGACLWFPRGGDDVAEPIPGAAGKYEWRTVVRSAVHSSKKDLGSELGEDLADVVFNELVPRVYDVQSERKVPIDIALASPSLEVGVDLPMVTESIMMNAIRNVATYRQKVGRIGREDRLDVVNVTLVSDSPVDLHYYRQPRKLVSLGRLDPIPLKDRNEAIVRSAMYMATWDWLAVNSDLPEVIPTGLAADGTSEFTVALKKCQASLDRSRAELSDHLALISRGMYHPDSAEIAGSISQAQEEISVLLRDASDTFEAGSVSGPITAADVIVYRLLGAGGRRLALRAPRLELERFHEIAEECASRCSRLSSSGIPSGVLNELFMMGRTGAWREDLLEAAASSLEGLARAGLQEYVLYDLDELHRRVIPGLISRLASLRSAGHDPVVFEVDRGYRRLLQENAWKGHYLSTLMQSLSVFESVRKARWFSRPENLFSSPDEPRTRVQGAPEGQDEVSLGEALFGFLPGLWSYRFPYGCYKVKVGALEAEPGGRLVASMDNMIEAGSKFELVARSLPAPPGLPGSIDVYAPTQVSLQRVRYKYLPIDWGRGVMLDRDEALTRESLDETGARSRRLVKVPKSFLNKWVYVEASEGQPLGPLAPDTGEIHLDGQSGPLSAAEMAENVRHPLFRSMLARVDWHISLKVTEYVYSVSRSYSRAGGEEVELAYKDPFGHIAIGTRYQTEGLSISLNPETFRASVSEIKQSMDGGVANWMPSLLKAFKAFLARLCIDSEYPANPFILDDLAALVINELGVERDRIAFGDFLDAYESLGRDLLKLREAARTMYASRLRRSVADPESFAPGEAPPEDAEVNERVSRLVRAVENLRPPGQGPDPAGFLESWIRGTLLNTFGIVALTALQQFSGANDSDVGYIVDPDAWEGGKPRVYLYDRAYFGNGSSAVAARYLHIPNILRHGDTVRSRFLPSDDYLSTLEEKLLQCPQFHTDISALTMFTRGGAGPGGITALRDVEDQAREVLHVARDVWTKLGLTNPSDAPRIALANGSADSIAARLRLDPDDFMRATTICWNGCPECTDRPDMIAGGRVGRYYVDKALLDAWFAHGVGSAQEYQMLDLADLADGKTAIGIGVLHRLRLDLPHRRIRSVQLPWTIGFHLNRGEGAEAAKLLLRVSDVVDLQLAESAVGGVAAGVESVGFKRLLWFDLVLTAYMDVLGLLGDSRKEVKLVYYDCRDIAFDDIGLSARMVDAVLSEARKSGVVQGLKNLSDMLTWLLTRGFRVWICVDDRRSEEEGVRAFLRRMSRLGAEGLHILTKHVDRGAMHKKALVSPVGVLNGSANLTDAATGRNEEILNHFFFGTREYTQLKTNVEDTFHGAEHWEP